MQFLNASLTTPAASIGEAMRRVIRPQVGRVGDGGERLTRRDAGAKLK